MAWKNGATPTTTSSAVNSRALGLPGVGDQVGVGQLALEQASGAARVGQGGQVAGGVDGDPGGGVVVGDQVAEQGGAVGLAEHQRLGDPRLLGAAQAVSRNGGTVTSREAPASASCPASRPSAAGWRR